MATCDVFQFPFSTHVVQVVYLTLCNFFLQIFCFRYDTENKDKVAKSLSFMPGFIATAIYKDDKDGDKEEENEEEEEDPCFLASCP